MKFLEIIPGGRRVPMPWGVSWTPWAKFKCKVCGNVIEGDPLKFMHSKPDSCGCFDEF